MNEPALDLTVVMAVISSLKDKPVNPRTIIFSEVGLAGEVRVVPMAEQRINEAKKLGFETCILPKTSLDKMRKMEGIRLAGVENIRDFTAVWNSMMLTARFRERRKKERLRRKELSSYGKLEAETFGGP